MKIKKLVAGVLSAALVLTGIQFMPSAVMASPATVTANSGLTYSGSAQDLVTITGDDSSVWFTVAGTETTLAAPTNITLNQAEDAVASVTGPTPNDRAWTQGSPTGTAAGIYTYWWTEATITDDGEGHKSGVATTPQRVEVRIAQKPVTVTSINAADKTYDGTTTATLNYDTVEFGGKVDGDTLSVTATGTFTDTTVGNSKTVNIDGINLGGQDAANYTLATTGYQRTATADITQRDSSVNTDSYGLQYVLGDTEETNYSISESTYGSKWSDRNVPVLSDGASGDTVSFTALSATRSEGTGALVVGTGSAAVTGTVVIYNSAGNDVTSSYAITDDDTSTDGLQVQLTSVPVTITSSSSGLPAVTSVEITTPTGFDGTLVAGDRVTFTADITSTGGATTAGTWSSSDTSIATVNDGVVEAQSTGWGQANIKLTSNYDSTKSFTVPIKVKNKKIKGMSVQLNGNATVGSTLQAVVSCENSEYIDGTPTYRYTWELWNTDSSGATTGDPQTLTDNTSSLTITSSFVDKKVQVIVDAVDPYSKVESSVVTAYSAKVTNAPTLFFASPFCIKLQNKNVGCCKTIL